MNRETKRMLQRQGSLTADGSPKAQRRQPTARAPKEQRPNPREFVGEVVAELRKVAWPTRSEVIHYSVIVFVTVVVLTAFVGVIDYGLGDFVLRLFKS